MRCGSSSCPLEIAIFSESSLCKLSSAPKIGFTPSSEAILENALPGLNIVGADLVEVEPFYDPAETTAIAANNVLAKLVTCIAYNKLSTKEKA